MLAQLNRTPDCVIDIGVRTGTPWLYRQYADVFHILVDPQLGGKALLENAPANFIFINKAVGDKVNTLTLREQGLKSTFLDRTELTRSSRGRSYDVSVTTLDNIIDQHAVFAQRIALKIDTEGFEVQVIHGLQRYLDKIDFIIAEASILNRFEKQHDFPELIWEFYKKGFRFYNLLDNVKCPTPLVYDCIFFPQHDPIFSKL